MAVSTVSDREQRLKALPSTRYVHVACHGVFEPNVVDRSRLMIVTPANEPELLTIPDNWPQPREHIVLSS